LWEMRNHATVVDFVITVKIEHLALDTHAIIADGKSGALTRQIPFFGQHSIRRPPIIPTAGHSSLFVCTWQKRTWVAVVPIGATMPVDVAVRAASWPCL